MARAPLNDSQEVFLARHLLNSGGKSVRALPYYTAVARQLSAVQLASLAARRVSRIARKVWATAPSSGDEDILDRFGVFTPDALPTLALRPRAVWCDAGRRDETLRALSTVRGAKERALARARRAARREFDVFGTVVSFGPRGSIDWSLDCGSGYRYPMVPAHRYSIAREGADPKYPWVLGRLDQLIALGQGYWAAADPEEHRQLAVEFVAQSLDFIHANPVGQGVQWVSPMEVALRAANLAQSLVMFRDADPVREAGFLLTFLRSLEEHAAFVEANLEDAGTVANNHLVANYVGLLVVSLLFPQLSESSRRAAAAAVGIQKQIRAQVHEDGYSFEGSVGYHRLATELFTLAYLVAFENGVDLGATFEGRLHRMFAVAQAYCSDLGQAPQIGDNDSGRAVALCDRPSLDHGYLSALGSAIFEDPTLKRDGGFPDEAAWLLGEAGVKRFESMRPQAGLPWFCSRPGGLCLLRSAEALLAVSAGPQGQGGVGGHNHNDKLSFELHVAGQPVIVDIGTGTYTRDAAVRNRFRSTGSHNTVEIDGEEQSPIPEGRLFALPDPTGAEVIRLERTGRSSSLVARHHGYQRLRPPVVVERTFLLDEERGLLVRDLLQGEGKHRAVGRLHLADREVRLRKASSEEVARAKRIRMPSIAFGIQAAEIGKPGESNPVVLFEDGLRVELEESLYSPSYGQIRPALAIAYRIERELPAAMAVAILF